MLGNDQNKSPLSQNKKGIMRGAGGYIASGAGKVKNSVSPIFSSIKGVVYESNEESETFSYTGKVDLKSADGQSYFLPKLKEVQDLRITPASVNVAGSSDLERSAMLNFKIKDKEYSLAVDKIEAAQGEYYAIRNVKDKNLLKKIFHNIKRKSSDIIALECKTLENGLIEVLENKKSQYLKTEEQIKMSVEGNIAPVRRKGGEFTLASFINPPLHIAGVFLKVGSGLSCGILKSISGFVSSLSSGLDELSNSVIEKNDTSVLRKAASYTLKGGAVATGSISLLFPVLKGIVRTAQHFGHFGIACVKGLAVVAFNRDKQNINAVKHNIKAIFRSYGQYIRNIKGELIEKAGHIKNIVVNSDQIQQDSENFDKSLTHKELDIDSQVEKDSQTRSSVTSIIHDENNHVPIQIPNQDLDVALRSGLNVSTMSLKIEEDNSMDTAPPSTPSADNNQRHSTEVKLER